MQRVEQFVLLVEGNLMHALYCWTINAQVEIALNRYWQQTTDSAADTARSGTDS